MALGLAACGGAAPSGDGTVEPAVDVEAVIPEGAGTIVRARPRALLAAEELAAVVRAVAPDEALDAFSQRHGVDPRTLETVVLATYGEHDRVVLASGPFLARVVVGEIGHRMSPLESSADAPIYRRAGTYLRRRFELLALGSHELALVDGPPSLAGRLVASRSGPMASGRTSEPPTEVGIAAARLRTLLEGERDAPFLWIQHGRPDLPSEGVGLLLARLEDAALTLSTGEPGMVVVRVRLYGEFPPGADENFRTLIGSLSEAELGRALGLEEIARTLAIDVVGPEIRLAATLRSSTLARGLRLFGGAGIGELIELGPG
jgi:hypothetical protein